MLALGTACSSSKNLPENTKADFTTRITSSGLKHFQMQLVPLNQDHGRPKQQSKRRLHGDTRAPKPDRQAKHNEKMLLAQLEVQIINSQYCRDGYWLLDKDLYTHQPYIRGECNEVATSTDRRQFPDTLTKW